MGSIRLTQEGRTQVERARTMRGYSQSRWASVAGVGEATLKRFVQGYPVRPDTFNVLCQAIGLESFEALVAWDELDSTKVVSSPEIEVLADDDQGTEPSANTFVPSEPDAFTLEERKYGVSISAIMSESKQLKAMALIEQLKNVLQDVDVVITQGSPHPL